MPLKLGVHLHLRLGTLLFRYFKKGKVAVEVFWKMFILSNQTDLCCAAPIATTKEERKLDPMRNNSINAREKWSWVATFCFSFCDLSCGSLYGFCSRIYKTRSRKKQKSHDVNSLKVPSLLLFLVGILLILTVEWHEAQRSLWPNI